MTVRAWLARPQEFDIAALQRTLGQAEKTKADRFRFAADRNAFVLSHALQRAQLSQTLNTPPYELQFGRTAKGRPMLTHPKADNLAFSASRRREVVVYAQATISQLGIDVEKIVAIDNPEALLAKFLDSTNIALLSGSGKHRTFTRLWTITEACAKARGTGLATF